MEGKGEGKKLKIKKLGKNVKRFTDLRLTVRGEGKKRFSCRSKTCLRLKKMFSLSTITIHVTKNIYFCSDLFAIWSYSRHDSRDGCSWVVTERLVQLAVLNKYTTSKLALSLYATHMRTLTRTHKYTHTQLSLSSKSFQILLDHPSYMGRSDLSLRKGKTGAAGWKQTRSSPSLLTFHLIF